MSRADRRAWVLNRGELRKAWKASGQEVGEYIKANRQWVDQQIAHIRAANPGASPYEG